LALPYHLGKTGGTTITWDIEPVSHPKVEEGRCKIVGYSREQARLDHPAHPMHEGRGERRETTGGIIRNLKDEGYRFASVSELLGSADRG
jgi:peptidoglycan-N-acetylglucosamine deacetylase